MTTESVAYGNRAVVIGMPCAPEWHRDGMLELVGPAAFGYEIDYVELERDPELVRQDVRDGLLSAERAFEVYGVDAAS